MGMFGKPDPQKAPPDRIDKFITAVVNEDSMAALKMLEDSGGMCNAIALAKAAKTRSEYTRAHVGGWNEVHFAMSSHGDEQTLAVGDRIASRYESMYVPVASITAKKCER